MDREVVLALLLVGAATWASSALVPREAASADGSGAARERDAFRRLLVPLMPGAVLLAALLGWTAVESDALETREAVPLLATLVACGVCGVIARACWRALTAVVAARTTRTAGTVGLLRPRILLADGFRDLLTPGEVEAVRMHEEAHVRHHDPLGICVAQFMTDLQWPVPGAPARLAAWLHAVELARDDEARARGADGADLATAIVKAARFARKSAPSAALAGTAVRLRERVERLLTPLPAPEPVRRRLPALLFPASVAAAFPCGAAFGELLVLQVLGWSL